MSQTAPSWRPTPSRWSAAGGRGPGRTQEALAHQAGLSRNYVGMLERGERTPTLAEVIAGQTPLRRTESEVTCFINNLGLGYQFAAAGAVVYRKAKEAGLGHDLPTDWFTQDVHP